MSVAQEFIASPGFTLRDFLRLYLLDEDLSVTLVRRINGVEQVTLLTLEPDESVRIRQETEHFAEDGGVA